MLGLLAGWGWSIQPGTGQLGTRVGVVNDQDLCHWFWGKFPTPQKPIKGPPIRVMCVDTTADSSTVARMLIQQQLLLQQQHGSRPCRSSRCFVFEKIEAGVDWNLKTTNVLNTLCKHVECLSSRCIEIPKDDWQRPSPQAPTDAFEWPPARTSGIPWHVRWGFKGILDRFFFQTFFFGR